MASISYFDQATVSSDSTVISRINRSELITKIQSIETDTYFDSTAEITKVNIYYYHQDGRQKKKIVHAGPDLTGNASWTYNAHDGTWSKGRVKVFDSDGAIRYLFADTIGSSEDITHSGGQMDLNIS
jgi:hypothetical protein